MAGVIRIVSLCLIVACAGLARAQDEPILQPETQPTHEPNARRLGFFSGTYNRCEFEQPRFQIEPFVWYASPGGSVGFTGNDLATTKDLSIDDPRLGGGVEAHFRQGPWRVSLLGSITSQHGGSVAQNAMTLGSLNVAPGDTLVTEIDLDTFGLRAGYQIWSYATDLDEFGVQLMRSSFEAVVGLRAYDYDLSVSRTSGIPASNQGDMFHIEPIVGFKWAVEFDEKYGIDLSTNFGYLPEIDDQSSSSLDITAGFRYSPVPNVAAQIGYRLLVFDLSSDDVEAEGALAGLYGGLSISF